MWPKWSIRHQKQFLIFLILKESDVRRERPIIHQNNFYIFIFLKEVSCDEYGQLETKRKNK